MSAQNLVSTISDDENTTRIERFQSLSAGQYWRAKENLEPNDDTWDTPRGTVLLLESIKWVDDIPHTIVLLDHPSKQRPGYSRGTQSYLTEDFLSKFEYEPDAEAIRAAEISDIQRKVMAIQQDMMDVQSNPARLAEIVTERMGDEPAMLALPNNIDPNSVVGAMSLVATQGSIATLKAHAMREHKAATVTATWIKEKSGEISDAIVSMTPYFEEKAAAALACTEDVRTQVDKIMRGIETLDLYVGTGVHVEMIVEGEPAPEQEPLTLMQRKLYMDEELAVFADVDEYFDFHNKDEFFAALKERPALLDQILPAPRSVVIMAVSRRIRDYGEVFTNAAFNRENAKVFLLVRNGQNVHVVYSPVETHTDANTLFPLRGETDKCFTGYDGSQITFRDLDYTAKLARHESMALHYKRFLVLLCGLDHRLKLFGDFYEGQQSLNFISQEFQQKYFRFAEDADNSLLLSGWTTEEPVLEWMVRMNKGLQSGSRVACYWPILATPNSAPGAFTSGDAYRRARLKSDFDICIAYRNGEHLYVDMAISGRTRQSAKVRVTPGQNNGGYLVLDMIDPTLLHRYIHDRQSRPDHLFYITTFKRAMAAVEADRILESDMRDRMAQAITAGGLPVDDIPNVVSRTIANWRAAHRGAALPSFIDGQAPAEWKAILNHLWLAAGLAEQQANAIQAHLSGLGMTVLRVSMKGTGNLVAYVAPSDADIDEVNFIHPWVKRIPVTIRKKTVSTLPHTWVVLRDLISEATITEWPAAAEWKARRDPGVSREGLLKIIEQVQAFPESARSLFSIKGSALENLRDDWLFKRDDLSKKLVSSPALSLPLGVVEYDGVVNVVTLSIEGSNFLAWASARDSHYCQRATITKLVSIYRNKPSHEAQFNNVIADGLYGIGNTKNICFSICKAEDINLNDRIQISDLHERYHNNTCGDLNPSLTAFLPKYLEANKRSKTSTMLLPFTDIDSVTGIEFEVATDPYAVYRYLLTQSGNDKSEPWYLVINCKDATPKFEMFDKSFRSHGNITSTLRDMDSKFRDKEAAIGFIKRQLKGRMPEPVSLNGFELYTNDPLGLKLNEIAS